MEAAGLYSCVLQSRKFETWFENRDVVVKTAPFSQPPGASVMQALKGVV